MGILDNYLEIVDSDAEFEKYKEKDKFRPYDSVDDKEDYREDKPERQVMSVTPKQATAQQKTGHPSLKTEPGGQEIRLRREQMGYTDLYLNYLNEQEIYQDIYEDLAFDVFVQEISPAQLKGLIGKEQSYLKQLAQQKAKFADNPQVVAAIDAKIKASGVSLGKLQNKLTKSPEAAGMPDQPAGGASQADIPAAPVPPETPTVTAKQLAQQKAAAAKTPQGTEKDLQAAQGAPKTQAPPAEVPAAQDPSLYQQGKDLAAQGVEKGKELGGQAVDKAKEVGGQVADKVKDADTAIKGALPEPATQALDTAGQAAGQAAQTVAGKVGADPGTAGAIGSAATAIGGSPLGLAALGGAAAYGGYKLYKRFMSKSATACKGYSGPDKTSCMKSYMDAKRNQAQTRGAEAGGPE